MGCKLAVISDLHFECHKILGGPMEAGRNRRCRGIGEAVKHAVALAGKKRADAMVVTGDVFDCAAPRPEVIAEAAEAFATANFPCYLLPGNHERSSDQPGHSALAALRHSKNCVVVDVPTVVLKNTVKGGCLLVPFVTDPSVVVTALVEQHSPAYVFLHAGIVAPGDPPWCQEAKNTISAQDALDWARGGVRGILAGDWHRHRIHSAKDPLVVQVGALTSVDFGDPPEVGKMVLLDAGSGKVDVFDIPGPRLLSMTMPELRALAAGQWPALYVGLASCDCYIRVQCAPEERAEAEGILESELSRTWLGGETEKLRVVDWTVDALPTSEKDDLARAAEVAAAQPKVSAEEAVRAFCTAAVPDNPALAQHAGDIAAEVLR